MGWKMPVVLSCMFCLMINCLSACFDRISALSAGCGCGIRPVRGTRNFDRQKQNMQLRTTVFYIQNKYPLDNRIILTRII